MLVIASTSAPQALTNIATNLRKQCSNQWAMPARDLTPSSGLATRLDPAPKLLTVIERNKIQSC
jgi:hypothetical protein